MNARLTLFTNFLLLNVVFVTQIFLISNMKGFLRLRACLTKENNLGL